MVKSARFQTQKPDWQMPVLIMCDTQLSGGIQAQAELDQQEKTDDGPEDWRPSYYFLK